MRSKIITTVMVILIVGPFAYTGYTDALSIKHHLAQQHEHIQKLKTESVQLDKQLSKTKATKTQSEAQIQQLEQQTQDATNQRQQLEAQLGAN